MADLAAPSADGLDDLRAAIDGIDDALLDLLERRAAVVRELSHRKAPGSPMRPAREADIARRIAARSGPPPAGFAHGLWREIISAASHMQRPTRIVVGAPPAADEDSGPMALARDHFGRFAQLARVDSAQRAIAAVGAGEADAALLPRILSGEERPWWPDLVGGAGAGEALRVIGLLPLIDRPVGRAFPEMMVVGTAPIAPSGADRSLIAVQFCEPVSRDRQIALFNAVGLAPRMMAHVRPGGGVRDLGDLAIVMIETPGYVEERDPRLDEIVAANRAVVDWARRLGAYPAPLREAG